MLEPHTIDRGRRAENAYFRREDSHLLERARLAEQARLQQQALAAALGVQDAEAVGRLYIWGMRAESAALLEWLPALEIAWLDGVDEGERDLLRQQFNGEHAGAAARQLLEEWLAHRPSHGLFAAARRALRLRLQPLDSDAREAAITRIIARCEAAARAAGGILGFGALSTDERDHIDSIRHELARER